MQRPEVRILQNQSSEEKEIEPNQYEVDALLAKYGFKSNNTFSTNTFTAQSQDNRTFDEIVKQHEQQRLRQQQQANRARAITFNDNNVHWAETKWSSLDDDSGLNFGIQVNIVSDQKF